jgi:diguanylate cyclase (GGDEF)-like protein/PAS domain S-box-containing protein
MRSLQTKVALLLAVCFFCCFLGVYSWQAQQRQALERATQILKSDERKRSQRLFALYDATLQNFCNKESLRTELVTFLQHPTKDEGARLLSSALVTNNLTKLWVYNAAGSLVYDCAQTKASLTSPVTPAQLRTQLTMTRRAHFFMETPEGLLELRGATIHPSDDNERVQPPQGFLVVGRLWDRRACEQFGDLTGSTVTHAPSVHRPLPDLDQNGSAQLELPLRDDHGVVAHLHLRFQVPLLKMQQDALRATPLWLFGFSSALFLALSIALYYWISAPLQLITRCLRQQTPEPLEEFLPDTQEVFELIGMVREFFWQRQIIQQDCDSLEQRVGERTKELHDAMSSMSEMQARLQAVLANLPVVVFALDEQGLIRFFEGKGMESVGIRSPRVVGRSVFRHFHFRKESEHGRRIHDVLAGEERSWTMKIGARYFDIQCSPLRDESGAVHSLIGVALDVTDRVRFEDRLLYQAQHDALTGLPNRRLFQDRLDQALLRGRRDDRQVAVLFLDLDNFKLVNDTLGHDAGDQLLKQITRRLSAVLGPSHLLARQGGDEFTILVEHFSAPSTVERLAERIRASMDESFALEGQAVFCRSSVGVVYSSPSSSVSEMLRNADIAMYRSKEEGKGRYTTFDESMNVRLQERLALESDLRNALQNDELTLCYQPIVSLVDQQLKGVEALVRWQHPRLGAIPPSRFVTIAEEAGLSISLDYWVLRTACRQLAQWNRTLPAPLNVSVNISTRQFQRTDLDSAVKMILAETGLSAQQLTLEITEGVMMHDPHGAADILRRLKSLGVQIAIDDFGTGYSSMAYLSNLPLDILKIDRSFIACMTDHKENAAIVEAIIHMARALSLRVTSEGVETREQAAALHQLACHQAQGYLFSYPLTPLQLETRLFAVASEEARAA